jgi:hypothetical protein
MVHLAGVRGRRRDVDEPEPPRVLYRHTQTGYTTAIGLGFAAASQVVTLVNAVRRHKPRAWVYAPGIVVTAGLAWAFSALTVEITGETLAVSFRRGLLLRTIDLAAVRSAERMRTPWYWGWGMRLTSRGWLYNVQGRDAVRVDVEGGRGVLIGTDEPARLAAAIEAIKPG